MELLKKLYEIHALSGKEKHIRNFIKSYIFENITNVKITGDKIGNLYITKGQAETYPCIVAHLDQVQRLHSKDFRAIETEDIIFGYSPSNRRQEGLGADDKNGIWVALQCLMKYEALKIAFFVGEEVGCVGSSAANLNFFSNCRFVIQPDRRGYSDVITQISWESLCSEQFLSEIQPEQFGYKPTDGLMTDIQALRGNGLEISCINLSCGYYEPHTDREFTIKNDLKNCLEYVQFIIEYCTEIYHHEAETLPGNYLGDGDDMEQMLFDIMMTHPDYTANDAWDVYQTNFPGFEREEFIMMYHEYMDAFGIEPPKFQKVCNNRQKTKSKKKQTKSSSTRHRQNFILFPETKSQKKNRLHEGIDTEKSILSNTSQPVNV